MLECAPRLCDCFIITLVSRGSGDQDLAQNLNAFNRRVDPDKISGEVRTCQTLILTGRSTDFGVELTRFFSSGAPLLVGRSILFFFLALVFEAVRRIPPGSIPRGLGAARDVSPKRDKTRRHAVMHVMTLKSCAQKLLWQTMTEVAHRRRVQR